MMILIIITDRPAQRTIGDLLEIRLLPEVLVNFSCV